MSDDVFDRALDRPSRSFGLNDPEFPDSCHRIKALKEALLNLVDRVTEDDGEGCQTGVNAAEMISARVVLLKEADQ